MQLGRVQHLRRIFVSLGIGKGTTLQQEMPS